MGRARSAEFSFRLFEAMTSYRHAMRRMRAALPVSEAEVRVLMYLSGRQGISQSGLATLLQLKPISLTRLIDHLEERRFLVRRRDPADRRANQLSLTAVGTMIVNDMWRIVMEAGDIVAAKIDPKMLPTFARGLELMSQALARDQGGGHLLSERGEALGSRRAKRKGA